MKSLSDLNKNHHPGCPCFYCVDTYYYNVDDILKPRKGAGLNWGTIKVVGLASSNFGKRIIFTSFTNKSLNRYSISELGNMYNITQKDDSFDDKANAEREFILRNHFKRVKG